MSARSLVSECPSWRNHPVLYQAAYKHQLPVQWHEHAFQVLKEITEICSISIAEAMSGEVGLANQYTSRYLTSIALIMPDRPAHFGEP